MLPTALTGASHCPNRRCPVLPGDGGRDGEDEEGGEGALQGAQLQDGYVLQVGSALPHQAPQLKISNFPLSC